MSNPVKPYQRAIVKTLVSRLSEDRKFIQVVSGPRQTGKTTAILQALEQLEAIEQPEARGPVKTIFIQAGQVANSGQEWLRREWDSARQFAATQKTILAIDEIQAIKQWSSVVKELWDEDTRTESQLLVVLSGSSSLVLQHGLTEGLTGRFEEIKNYQWDFNECAEAFGYSLEQYLFFGGYPGSAGFVEDSSRWLDYMQNSIINPSVLKDVIALDKITKPALMEALFTLGSAYSGQEVSFRKLMGQLDDAGNATTIAHYLTLLGQAGLLCGIQKYSPKLLKTRASSPRLNVFDTSLMVASYGAGRENLLKDSALRGHLEECAVGAYLLKRGLREHFNVYWWREGNYEVDFVLESGRSLTAVEVKSGRIKTGNGLDVFHEKFKPQKTLIVGSSSAPLEDFLSGGVDLF